jgi:hypothetical protein
MASRGPGGLFKSTARAASGGAVLFGILLALLFMQSMGDGDGDAETESAGDKLLLTSSETGSGDVLNSLASEVAAPDEEPPSNASGLTDEEQKALDGGVLTLLIDEHDYLMKIPSDPNAIYRPLALGKAVDLAALAEGDANGLRVRIERRETARAAAEHDLVKKLADAGIAADAVHIASDFVP